MYIKYKPQDQRIPDTQYRDTLIDIRDNGVWEKAQAGDDKGRLTRTVLGHQNRFLVENGAPFITERTLEPNWKKSIAPWKQAVGEIFAFINGARTTEALQDFGCNYWRFWATEKKCAKRGLPPGDLGDGSYGDAFANFPGPNGPINQFEHVVKQMRYKPHLKTHFISPWVPPFVYRHEDAEQKVVVCPCHGWIYFHIIQGKISLHMTQRSADVPVGVPNNMVQYFALLLAVAHVMDLTPHEFVHNMINCHYYDDQVEDVNTLIERPVYPFPILRLENPPDNLFDFRKEHFILEEYQAGEYIGPPAAI